MGAEGMAEESVRLHAAGSLRPALTEVSAAFTRAHDIAVRMEFGASGTLRQRFESGEAGDVFASANVDHLLSLAMFMLSPDGQEILGRHGFAAPTRPERRAGPP